MEFLFFSFESFISLFLYFSGKDETKTKHLVVLKGERVKMAETIREPSGNREFLDENRSNDDKEDAPLPVLHVSRIKRSAMDFYKHTLGAPKFVVS